ncbi:RNA-dependent ATPase rok1 [Tulasnella sp. UAMH 9824]|nr:RNA-dependent ATPase rok1 [Tulasnella sp. UAMH 9824]
MEAFALLSRGGARFNKDRFKDQVRLFESTGKASTSLDTSIGAASLPTELDFFKYALGSDAKTRSAKSKGKLPAPTRAPPTDSPTEAEDAISVDEEDSSGDESSVSYIPKRGKSIHRIAATGSRIPEPAGDFESLSQRYGLSQLLLDNLASGGFSHPTAIQSQAVPILLEKRDLAGISPTGTGKTLAYVLPMFALLGSPLTSKDRPEAQQSMKQHGPRALVVCPTRELAGQIYNECMKLAQGRKWNILLFSKGASSSKQKKAMGKVDVVIGTPLRILAAIREEDIRLDNVRYLVLDEADNLLDSDFGKQTEEVLESCTHPDLQKSIFSATLPQVAEQVAKRALVDPVRVVVGIKDSASLNVAQTLTYCGTEVGKLFALRQLLATGPPLPLLVFVQSKERAKQLYQEFLYDNLTVDQLHSDMTSKQRLESVARMRSGETWVMVCTEVMARGMDFGGIKGVVNYDFPTTVQGYVHRIGRTGRAGRTGVAITYFTDADIPFLRPIAQMINQTHIQQLAFASAKSTINIDEATRELIASVAPKPEAQIPEWMLKLNKARKMKSDEKRRRKVKRDSVTKVAGGSVGRRDALRKRYGGKKEKKLGPRGGRNRLRTKSSGIGNDEEWSGLS